MNEFMLALHLTSQALHNGIFITNRYDKETTALFLQVYDDLKNKPESKIPISKNDKDTRIECVYT